MIQIEYDDQANAAYIRLVPAIAPGGVYSTYPCDPIAVGGMINLDFDNEGRLLGIEVLDARSKLHRMLLEPSGESTELVDDDDLPDD